MPDTGNQIRRERGPENHFYKLDHKGGFLSPYDT
jgi:hypothetical protein